jgi:hypothetical protein
MFIDELGCILCSLSCGGHLFGVPPLQNCSISPLQVLSVVLGICLAISILITSKKKQNAFSAMIAWQRVCSVFYSGFIE